MTISWSDIRQLLKGLQRCQSLTRETQTLLGAADSMATDTKTPDTPKQDTIFQEIAVSNATPSDTRKDKAVEFLIAADSGSVEFDEAEEEHVLRRIDRRVLPLILGAYFFQQLDKSSLSYVSIFGLVKEANLVGKQYSWLGSILYFAQLVMQPLVAFLLVKLPTGKLLGFAVICWGIAETLMAACTGFKSLAALRFLLGSFEAFIAPICVVVTQMWWRRREQTLRNSYWNAMNGVTSVFGSLLTFGLGHIHSKSVHRYQIIFMFCGLMTVVFGCLVLWLMPDSPMDAKYLTQREKVVATRRLRANQQGITSRDWKMSHVMETATDVKTYLWFLLIFSISVPSGGIGTFGSLIVKDFGYSSFAAILFNIPFGVIQVLLIIGAAALSNKLKRKGLVITMISVLPVIGCIILLTVPRRQKGVLLFGYYLVSCLAAITPMVYAW